MTLLPELHLKRVVAHAGCKTHSETFSITLFLKKVTNKQCICLGFTSVKPASSTGSTSMCNTYRHMQHIQAQAVFCFQRQRHAENQPLHMSRASVSCSLLRPDQMWAFQHKSCKTFPYPTLPRAIRKISPSWRTLLFSSSLKSHSEIIPSSMQKKKRKKSPCNSGELEDILS